MSDADAKLAAFWRESARKCPTLRFRLAVLERRARRRFYLHTSWVAAAAWFVTACLAMIAPDLPALSVSQPMPGAVAIVSVVVTAVYPFGIHTQPPDLSERQILLALAIAPRCSALGFSVRLKV